MKINYTSARSYAAKIQSRRFPSVNFAAYKEDGEEAILLAKIKEQVQEMLKSSTFIKADELNELKTKLADAEKAMATAKPENYDTLIKEHSDLMAEFKAFTEQGATTKLLTVKEQISKFITEFPEKWEAFKKGEIKQLDMGLVVNKAPITMTIGTSSNGSVFVPNVEVMPGLVDLARNKPFIEQYANTSNTSSSRIVWAEKTNPQGNAAFIGEGVLKPLISFEFKTNESFAKKIADKIKVSTEMLADVDFMAAEIEKELRYQVDIAVDAALLSGNGNGSSAATNLKGLNQYAGGYVLTSINTTLPNNFDAIRAAIAQIVSLNFNPDFVFVNPIDGANMDLVKDTMGRPLWMEYKTQDGKIFRLTVVETNQIPVGYFLVGDMTRYKIRNYEGFVIKYGWVNDDFEKNLVTIIGERRLHDFVADNEVGAFVYDTFSNVKTAIGTL